MHESLGSFARKQRLALLGFYICSFVFAVAVGTVEHLSHVYRLPLLAIAAVTAICGAFSLYQFFRTTDEFRQNINRRAVEFAFIGSLIASITAALLQSLGIPRLSPYLLPAVMVALWSVGLFFSARRFE